MASILLTEDDEDIRELVEDELLEAGYEVDATDTVAGALSRLDARSYDLLLTDGRLPDGTGLTVADRAMRKGIKVLFFSGFLSDFPADELSQHTVVAKPVDMDVLVGIVDRLIAAS